MAQKKQQKENAANPSSGQLVLETKNFPITLYRVSKEWIHNLYLEMRRTMMAKAIEYDAPKEFLSYVNHLELHFSQNAEITLEYNGPEASETVVVSRSPIEENPASTNSAAPEEKPEAPAVEASPEEAAAEAPAEETAGDEGQEAAPAE